MATPREQNSPLAEQTSDDQPASGQASRTLPDMRVVGVGASAGGLQALRTLFSSVPEQSGLCFVVVVHLAADHESHLAPLLQLHSPIPVQQVTGATALQPNHIYVIPPNANIDAIDTHVRLSDLEVQRQNRAPIDHFFRTLAQAQGERAVGIVLTGTGSDGTAGLALIQERGGLTIAQSPDEAEYDAMPRSAISASVADLVLPLDQIVARLVEIGQVSPDLAPSAEGDGGGSAAPKDHDESQFQKILHHLRVQTGHDFTGHKRASLLRRIRRRMPLNRVGTLGEYLKVLQEQDQEVALLFRDLLITVTEFFRDPDVYEHLEKHVIGQLFEDAGPEDPVRVWSVGCATGEEAYSLAMLLLEEEKRRHARIRQAQVFASDLCQPALSQARKAVYNPESVEVRVSTERIKQFFEKSNGSYRIRSQVRDRVVFAPHDILRDPPFSHIHLLACRNVMIYLERSVQQQLAALFHYALEPGGYLLLGTAEAIDQELFTCENKKLGLYRRRDMASRKPPFSVFSQAAHLPALEAPDGEPAAPRKSYGALHEQVVEQYAPPSVLIDPDGEMVHYSVRASRYLHLPDGGEPTSNIFSLVLDPLRLALRAAVHAARQEQGDYRSRPVNLTVGSESCQVTLRVQRIDQPQLVGFFLVIFDELATSEESGPSVPRSDGDDSSTELEAELQQTRRWMEGLIEQHDDAQQKLQAYNEELVSTNEELRSTLEELESSKEEMQSMNEELTTLNQENLEKVAELDHLSTDLHNLLTATHLATVFLDRDLQIQRFTPAMAALFDLHERDRSRSLAELTHRFGYDELDQDVQAVLDRGDPVEREIRSEQGRWFMTRLQPYRTSADKIQGVVISFIDVTARKEAEEQIRHAKKLAEEVIDTVRNPMLVLGDDLRVHSANTAFYEYFNAAPEQITGKLVFELHQGRWDTPRLRELLEKVLPQTTTFEDFELEHEVDGGESRHLLLNARQIDHMQLILLAMEDVTDRTQARHALTQAHDELERQVAERSSELYTQSQRLRMLVRDLASAEQRERKRMASILHDELQQLLVGVKIHIGMSRDRNRDATIAQSLEQATRHLDEAIGTTKSLVRQVAPQALYEEGLISALTTLGEEMSRRHGLNVTIDSSTEEPALSDEASTLLYESVREMLFNVVKHADVNDAVVEVEEDHGRLYITVSDEGSGFLVDDKAAAENRSDFGLFSRVDRIEALGGHWAIDSSPGEGTRVRFNVPIDGKPADGPAVPPAQAVAAGAQPTVVPGGVATQIRVLVVDDHALVREGIVTMLNRDVRLTVIAEAADGVEAVAAVEQHQPDVVLMDVNMPRMNGIAATRELRRRWPGVVVVGLSMQARDERSARAMVEAGAAAFLSKSGDGTQMIQAIIDSAKGSA